MNMAHYLPGNVVKFKKLKGRDSLNYLYIKMCYIEA